MRIEIICTGDEVLTGAIVNTNFGYISQKLGDVGLGILWGTTVGDDRHTLLQAFRLASERADAVIVNGGLGPTVDDLSQEIAVKGKTEIAVLGAAINTISLNLREILGRITQTGSSLGDALNELPALRATWS